MKTLGILGTGTMGAGIAQIAAQSGYSVLFWNRKSASVEKGVSSVKKGLGRLLQKERITDSVPSHVDYALRLTSSLARWQERFGWSGGATTPLGADAASIYGLYVGQGGATRDFSGVIQFLRGS